MSTSILSLLSIYYILKSNQESRRDYLTYYSISFYIVIKYSRFLQSESISKLQTLYSSNPYSSRQYIIVSISLLQILQLYLARESVTTSKAFGPQARLARVASSRTSGIEHVIESLYVIESQKDRALSDRVRLYLQGLYSNRTLTLLYKQRQFLTLSSILNLTQLFNINLLSHYIFILDYSYVHNPGFLQHVIRTAPIKSLIGPRYKDIV